MSDKKGRYKYCIVPDCQSTTVKTPEKLFISLPNDLKVRKLWQKAMRRTTFVSNKGSKYCCEDHFDLENDLENYMYIKLMGSGNIKLKSGVVPHIFKCQKKETANHPRLLTVNRQAKNLVATLLTSTEENNVLPTHKDKSTQVDIISNKSSKGVQCNLLDKKDLKRNLDTAELHG